MNHSFVRYHLPPLAWAFLIFVSSSIPSDELPDFEVIGLDKIVHIALYLVLCWLIYRSVSLFGKRSALTPVHIMAISVLLTIVYGASDEFHQLFVRGRQASVFDLGADAVGALTFVLVHFVRTKR